MMKTTMTLAKNLQCSPFDIYAQDCDEVIMTINFYLILSRNPEAQQAAPKISNTRKQDQRIRVNDKTATGGWY